MQGDYRSPPGIEHDAALFNQIVHLKDKALMHRWINYQSGCVERVGKDLVKEEVPCARLGLSAMNTRTGSLPLSSNSISATPGPIPLTLPEKASASISCPAPYRLHTFCDFCAFQKDIPCEPVDFFIVHAMGMCHDQFKVITTVGDKRVDEQFTFLILEHLCCLFQSFGWVRECPGKLPTSALITEIVVFGMRNHNIESLCRRKKLRWFLEDLPDPGG